MKCGDNLQFYNFLQTVHDTILLDCRSAELYNVWVAFCTFLQENSWIAKRKGINVYKASGAWVPFLVLLVILDVVLFMLGFN